MPNPFFNNYNNAMEQDLLHDLVKETISIAGETMWYVVRSTPNLNQMTLQDVTTTFSKAYEFDVYIKSVDGFSGDGNFLSKFGLEIRDQVVLTVPLRLFQSTVGRSAQIPRPREGDLVYFPLNQKCFQIKFVDDKPFFYQFGTLASYDLRCEVFEYSDETFATGVPMIDSIASLSTSTRNLAQVDANNNPIVDGNGAYVLANTFNLAGVDPLEDNDEMNATANTIVDFNTANPFGTPGSYN